MADPIRAKYQIKLLHKYTKHSAHTGNKRMNWTASGANWLENMLPHRQTQHTNTPETHGMKLILELINSHRIEIIHYLLELKWKEKAPKWMKAYFNCHFFAFNLVVSAQSTGDFDFLLNWIDCREQAKVDRNKKHSTEKVYSNWRNRCL